MGFARAYCLANDWRDLTSHASKCVAEDQATLPDLRPPSFGYDRSNSRQLPCLRILQAVGSLRASTDISSAAVAVSFFCLWVAIFVTPYDEDQNVYSENEIICDLTDRGANSPVL